MVEWGPGIAIALWVMVIVGGIALGQYRQMRDERDKARHEAQAAKKETLDVTSTVTKLQTHITELNERFASTVMNYTGRLNAEEEKRTWVQSQLRVLIEKLEPHANGTTASRSCGGRDAAIAAVAAKLNGRSLIDAGTVAFGDIHDDN